MELFRTILTAIGATTIVCIVIATVWFSVALAVDNLDFETREVCEDKIYVVKVV